MRDLGQGSGISRGAVRYRERVKEEVVVSFRTHGVR